MDFLSTFSLPNLVEEHGCLDLLQDSQEEFGVAYPSNDSEISGLVSFRRGRLMDDILTSL